MNYADQEYPIGKNWKQLINSLEFELFSRWVRGFTNYSAYDESAASIKTRRLDKQRASGIRTANVTTRSASVVLFLVLQLQKS